MHGAAGIESSEQQPSILSADISVLSLNNRKFISKPISVNEVPEIVVHP